MGSKRQSTDLTATDNTPQATAEKHPSTDKATEKKAPHPASGGAVGALMRRPALKYVGFALLLAWHYALWFSPHIVPDINLLDERITVSWLFNLGAMVLSLLGIAIALGRKAHLSSRRWLYFAAPIASAVLTVFMCLVLAQLPTPIPMYVASVLLGPCEAATWIL